MLRVSIHQSEDGLDTLNWLKDLYGGSVLRHGSSKSNSWARKAQWCWSGGHSTGVNFLNHVLPYLQIKRYRATHALYIWSIRLGDRAELEKP